MHSQRMAIRAARSARVNAPAVRRNVRRYADAPRPQEQRPGQPNLSGGSSSSGGSSGSSSSSSSALASGAAGGAIASVLVFTAWYQFSGVGKAARSVKQTKAYLDSTAEQLKVQFKENTPEPNEAIETLKQQAYKYAVWIPGGREYVDKVFKDLDIIRNKHGEEVDNIVKDAYGELRSATSKGLNTEAASDVWNILSKYASKLASLSVDAGQDILNNHPSLKSSLGGSFDQLKQFGDNLGPEAKKQVEDSYNEIRDIINQGIKWDTVDRVRKLAQEKVKELQKLSEQAWNQGYEQVKPLLEKNPQVKELVEQNIDTFKKGNVTEAIDKVKNAAQSGQIGDLQSYIDSAKSKASNTSFGNLSKWIEQVPGGSQILPQLQKLQEVAQSQGPEAEKLAKDTFADIQQVLEKRSGQVEDLYNKAKKEAESR
ncbi:hypothetical protein PRZ48_011889 [Zasmidium cellare]|uniref:Uncharacterized protein n=1 Tax=Zasmidium cellare TaxID=395010 RepID=A0ABR0E853_ZASCE|nr:hypothetical protein PRZ48_011889 [Zasmidium cellare]